MKRLLSICLCLQLGCASLGEERIETRTKVISSQKGQTREPLAVNPVEPIWTDGVLSASATRDIQCTEVMEEKTQIRTYRVVPSKNVAVSFLGATALILAGGASVGAWGALYDPTLPEDEFQPADWLLVGGLLGGLAGAAYFYQTWNVFRASGSSDVGAVRHGFRTRPLGEPRVCETAPVDVQVGLTFGDERLSRTFEDGLVTLDFPADPELCPRELIGQQLTINWSDRGGEEAGEIWSGGLDNCALLHNVRRMQLDLDHELAGTERLDIETFLKVANRMSEIGEQLEQLDPSYPGYEELQGAERRHGKRLVAGAGEALEISLERLSNLPADADFDEVVDAGNEALATSQLVIGKQHSTKLRVHAVFASAVRTPAHVHALRAVSGDVGFCLVSDVCAHGISRDIAKELYAPVVVRAHESIAASLKKVRGAAKLDPTAATNLLEAQRVNAEWCDAINWDVALTGACEELVEARRSAWVSVARAEQRLVANAVTRTEKAWRAQFSTCRKLQRGIADLEGIRRCDGECAVALQKMRADHTALKNFTVADPSWSRSTLESVREDCKDAGCPSCP